ncbi:MAG: pentapeptide repeat-containing protein [Candidatus Peregrinibacteria bacterium]|nr:pentapeptide repeat-containing protein [Candidatus Peregrinibacteria bacterium]
MTTPEGVKKEEEAEVGVREVKISLEQTSMGGTATGDMIFMAQFGTGERITGAVVSIRSLSKKQLDEQLNSAGETLIRAGVNAFNALRAQFPQWKPDFSGKRFEQINLSGVNLSGANLQRTSFIGSNLENANLEGANCSKAMISSANLRDANLQNADFSLADLSCSILHGSDIRGAQMRTTEMDTGYLGEVTDQKGRKAKVLTVLGVKFNSKTTLPEKTSPGETRSSIHLAGKRIVASVEAVLEQTNH